MTSQITDSYRQINQISSRSAPRDKLHTNDTIFNSMVKPIILAENKVRNIANSQSALVIKPDDEHFYNLEEPQDCATNTCFRSKVEIKVENNYEPVGFSPLSLGRGGILGLLSDALANAEQFKHYSETVKYTSHEKRMIESLYIKDGETGNTVGPYKTSVWLENESKPTTRELLTIEDKGTVDKSDVPSYELEKLRMQSYD